MRLIDADELNYITDRVCAGHGEYYDSEIVTKKEIDNAPTINAVEVVRCYECIGKNTCKAVHFFGENGYCNKGVRLNDD